MLQKEDTVFFFYEKRIIKNNHSFSNSFKLIIILEKCRKAFIFLLTICACFTNLLSYYLINNLNYFYAFNSMKN